MPNPSEYPNFSGSQFNPERETITTPELDKIKDILRQFPSAFGNLVAETLRKEQIQQTNRPDQTHQAGLLGEITGKMWLKCIEGLPVAQQSMMISKLNQLQDHITQRLGFDDRVYSSGFMGEFATGVVLNKNGFKVLYPTANEDIYQSGDLITTLPNGRKAHVQSKTISLPEKWNRRTMKNNPLPIFSLLETPADLAQFDQVMHIQGINDRRILDRIYKIRQSALDISVQGKQHGFVPIFSLLMKPGDPELEAADIAIQTSRPTQLVETQAKTELELIRDRYRR